MHKASCFTFIDEMAEFCSRLQNYLHMCFDICNIFYYMFVRVINAGKSAVNEDQACCEVLMVKKRPTGSSTPCKPSKRRSSLPNGEGHSLAESSVSAELCNFFSVFLQIKLFDSVCFFGEVFT